MPRGLSVQPEVRRMCNGVSTCGFGRQQRERGRTHSLSCQWGWRAGGNLACIVPKIHSEMSPSSQFIRRTNAPPVLTGRHLMSFIRGVEADTAAGRAIAVAPLKLPTLKCPMDLKALVLPTWFPRSNHLPPSKSNTEGPFTQVLLKQ